MANLWSVLWINHELVDEQERKVVCLILTQSDARVVKFDKALQKEIIGLIEELE